MKIRTILFVSIMLMVATMAQAGPLDAVKGVLAGVGWEAVALGLSALLAIGGFATKAKWLSAVFVFVGTAFAGLATCAEAVGSVFSWGGIAIQDGKLTSDEIKQAPKLTEEVKDSIKKTWTSVKLAWESLGTAGGSDA